MHLAYFTERPYRYAPQDRVIEKGFFGTPNSFFDPAKGYELYHEYFDEKLLAEDLGFDGVGLNEHHGTPFTMGGVMDVEAAILARITKKVRIIMMGNPLPLGNPLRLAEELAMIDVISGGRLITGWVRGTGCEQFAHNSNPAYNREYFDEAHDFIVKAWTRPGPWRYEGKHFHYRFVDPWPLPMQKPHPPMWIPGLLSPETAIWAAGKGYPYMALATALEPTMELWNVYRDRAAQAGYQVGPENFGYLQSVYVAETEEKAYEVSKHAVFGGAGTGYSLFAQRPVLLSIRVQWQKRNPAPGGTVRGSEQRGWWFSIPGREQRSPLRPPFPTHRSIIAPRSGRNQAEFNIETMRKLILDSHAEGVKTFNIVCGTPDTVIRKLRVVLETLRPGILLLWQNDGPITRKERESNLKLLAAEVMPAIRDFSRELKLTSPFEVTPGSRPLASHGKPESVGSVEPWKAWLAANP